MAHHQPGTLTCWRAGRGVLLPLPGLPSVAVSTSGDRVEGPFTNETFYGRLVINHYATKSEEDYTFKVARGSAMSNGGKGIAFWERVHKK
jgi:hypothetical protein